MTYTNAVVSLRLETAIKDVFLTARKYLIKVGDTNEIIRHHARLFLDFHLGMIDSDEICEVFMEFMYSHVPDTALKEIDSVLKPYDYVIITDYKLAVNMITIIAKVPI